MNRQQNIDQTLYPDLNEVQHLEGANTNEQNVPSEEQNLQVQTTEESVCKVNGKRGRTVVIRRWYASFIFCNKDPCFNSDVEPTVVVLQQATTGLYCGPKSSGKKLFLLENQQEWDFYPLENGSDEGLLMLKDGTNRYMRAYPRLSRVLLQSYDDQQAAKYTFKKTVLPQRSEETVIVHPSSGKYLKEFVTRQNENRITLSDEDSAAIGWQSF